MDNAHPSFWQCRRLLTLSVDASKCRVSNFNIRTFNAQELHRVLVVGFLKGALGLCNRRNNRVAVERLGEESPQKAPTMTGMLGLRGKSALR